MIDILAVPGPARERCSGPARPVASDRAGQLDQPSRPTDLKVDVGVLCGVSDAAERTGSVSTARRAAARRPLVTWSIMPRPHPDPLPRAASTTSARRWWRGRPEQMFCDTPAWDEESCFDQKSRRSIQRIDTDAPPELDEASSTGGQPAPSARWHRCVL